MKKTMKVNQRKPKTKPKKATPRKRKQAVTPQVLAEGLKDPDEESDDYDNDVD